MVHPERVVFVGGVGVFSGVGVLMGVAGGLLVSC